MSTRIQDDFSSKGLTSLHWNGPQVVALVCGPLARWSEPMPRMRFALCREVIPAYDLPSVLRLAFATKDVTVGTVPGNGSVSHREFAPDQLEAFFARVNAALELRILGQREHLFEPRARCIASLDQVAPGDQQRRPHLLLGQLFPSPLRKFPEGEIAVAGEAVDPMQLQVLIEASAGGKSASASTASSSPRHRSAYGSRPDSESARIPRSRSAGAAEFRARSSRQPRHGR